MDPIRKITKKFTKKLGNKIINRQYFHRKTELQILFQKKRSSQDFQKDFALALKWPMSFLNVFVFKKKKNSRKNLHIH